jgi:hypothetical protein
MNSPIISAILEAAKAQPPELQGRWIAEQAIASAYRSADAKISDQDLEAEFMAWHKRRQPNFPPGPFVVEQCVAWGRHLLSGRRHG